MILSLVEARYVTATDFTELVGSGPWMGKTGLLVELAGEAIG
ncbi:MAG: hypothetical protein WD269_09350 [Acidimicrobiia bacterium]